MTVVASVDQLERLRALLRERAGLVFDAARDNVLSGVLRERMAAAGAKDPDGFLERLADPAGAEELAALLDEVTIPETFFFRNAPQMSALQEVVLPELIAGANGRAVTAWSAGCSTGEEAYTLAILFAEALRHRNPLRESNILATDLSRAALLAARRGRYGRRAIANVEPGRLRRWFAADGGHFTVQPDLAAMVTFRRHNLVADPAPFADGTVDLVLCRNVTIYFDRPTTARLVSGFARVLRPGGYLLLGHSETLWRMSDEFELIPVGDAFLYRRPLANAAASAGTTAVPGRAAAPVDLAAPVAPGRRDRGESTSGTSAPAHAAVTVADIQEAVRSGRYDEAIAIASQVSARDPLLVEPHYLAGLALCNLGRDDEALGALRNALFLDAEAGFAHFLLAGALSRLGDEPGAVRAYSAAARTLGNRPSDAAAAELGGRGLAELVDLCRRLALAGAGNQRGGAR